MDHPLVVQQGEGQARRLADLAEGALQVRPQGQVLQALVKVQPGPRVIGQAVLKGQFRLALAVAQGQVAGEGKQVGLKAARGAGASAAGAVLGGGGRGGGGNVPGVIEHGAHKSGEGGAVALQQGFHRPPHPRGKPGHTGLCRPAPRIPGFPGEKNAPAPSRVLTWFGLGQFI